MARFPAFYQKVKSKNMQNIVRERQGRFDHPKIFRPPGGRTFLVGRTFIYPIIYDPLLIILLTINIGLRIKICSQRNS